MHGVETETIRHPVGVKKSPGKSRFEHGVCLLQMCGDLGCCVKSEVHVRLDNKENKATVVINHL